MILVYAKNNDSSEIQKIIERASDYKAKSYNLLKQNCGDFVMDAVGSVDLYIALTPRDSIPNIRYKYAEIITTGAWDKQYLGVDTKSEKAMELGYSLYLEQKILRNLLGR